MTKQEKQERRKVKHQLQKLATKHLSRNFRMLTTSKQQKIAGRKIADQLLAGRNPQFAVSLDGEKIVRMSI